MKDEFNEKSNFLGEPVSGFLRRGRTGEDYFIEGNNGERFFEGKKIWDGYADHWLNKNVSACLLKQKDYQDGKPIILIWLNDNLGNGDDASAKNFIEIYYNERLVKYTSSFFGHNAVNVNGMVFNFAKKINENERISPQEYFYRPPLGEFSPGQNGGYDVADPQMPHYDKFGRRFMRTVHVLRMEGDWIDCGGLADFFAEKIVINRHVKGVADDTYGDFSFFSNSCATAIRDGLRKHGFKNVSGIFPRDFFINCAKEFSLAASKNNGTKVFLKIMKQLKVNEAPFSKMTPILNPANYLRKFAYFDKLPISGLLL